MNLYSNFIFSWDGEKFDKIWKISDYAGAEILKVKFMDFQRLGNILLYEKMGLWNV